MKQKLADYVADFLVANGIKNIFTVVGGGAMHLNDAFGHHSKLKCIYNHHEQACSMAAEGYARLSGEIASVCVTTGPGGTNAITGVLGAYLDSIPMLVISGQVRYDTTARYCSRFTQGLPLRAVGDQEFDITRATSSLCKYAVMLESPLDIRYCLQKALHLATSGRQGPCWIDIPVDFQGAIIQIDDLREYKKQEQQKDDTLLPPPVSDDVIQKVIALIKDAKRPVFYAGNGIRLSGALEQFQKAIELLGIPICTYWDCIDLIATQHPLYTGRAGNMGDRAGNFAIQNADLVLAVGNRLSIRSVGYTWKTWARAAKVIMVDIDKAELKKPTLHIDMPIWADATDFLEKLNKGLEKHSTPLFCNKDWSATCQKWKEKYPVVLKRHLQQKGLANPYAAFDYISCTLPPDAVTVTSNGTCCVAGHQSWYIKEKSRFLNNNAVASMGYGLPASIGACIANNLKDTICLEGDGSIMMNLQELQTIVTNKLPIKIFLINNQGYHSIRQTQENLFKEHTKCGIGPESGDLSFPDFKKIAQAFGIPYYKAESNDDIKLAVDNTLCQKGFAMCEIFVSTKQIFEPKSATKRLEDGSLFSPPLEDLSPFLPPEELKQNMFIPVFTPPPTV